LVDGLNRQRIGTAAFINPSLWTSTLPHGSGQAITNHPMAFVGQQ